MKLKHDNPLSNVAFNCMLRHYSWAEEQGEARDLTERAMKWWTNKVGVKWCSLNPNGAAGTWV